MPTPRTMSLKAAATTMTLMNPIKAIGITKAAAPQVQKSMQSFSARLSHVSLKPCNICSTVCRCLRPRLFVRLNVFDCLTDMLLLLDAQQKNSLLRLVGILMKNLKSMMSTNSTEYFSISLWKRLWFYFFFSTICFPVHLCFSSSTHSLTSRQLPFITVSTSSSKERHAQQLAV